MAGITRVAGSRGANIANGRVAHDRARKRGNGLMTATALHRHSRIRDGDMHPARRALDDFEP